MVIFGWGLALAVFAIIMVLIGLTFRDFGEWSFDEVARVSNSNATVDAVLVETNGGATTSFGYEVLILPHGQQPKRSDHAVVSLYGAGRNDHAYGANLRWDIKRYARRGISGRATRRLDKRVPWR